ncbi:MAG: glycosyltransferase family 1 protein [Xenococcaceae cyanobacterium MO_188.B32]|nr:glycosyltransferase family 1 protein [Xenococcaceae cyanobacterium MO_188.B32]
MQLFHQGLKDLLNLDRYLPDKKLEFLSIETTLPPWLKNFTRAIPIYAIGLNLRREYRHIAMGLRALKFKDNHAIFVFEAYNQHFLFLLPLLALTKKEIFIMLHGNQQFAMNSKIKYLGLLYLKIYLKSLERFKALLLEIDDDILPPKVQLPERAKIVIPHPCRSDYLPNLKPGERLSSDTKIKIGIVGIIRADKPIGKLIKKIQEYQTKTEQNCELIIGTPKKQKPAYLDKLGIELRDTTTEKDYIRVLQEIDILVIHYDRDRYYYRTSGVISDAASCGCYIVASDYPLIKHQITYPVTIGSTFTDFEELETILDKAIDSVLTNGQDNHWLWREKRTAKYIASLLVA